MSTAFLSLSPSSRIYFRLLDLTRIIFMGTPAPVAPVLQRLHRMPGVDVVSAVTPPDRPRGRGRQPESPPVKVAAEALGIPVLQPSNLRGDSIQAGLSELSPDVIVVAAYGRFLPTAVLELPPHGCLNLHPSLLPRHRGPSPVATAILEGDETTGVSLMLLDEGMDTGPVIAATAVQMTGRETAGELTDTLFDLGGALLQENLPPWVEGRLRATPQEEARATVTRKLERADGLADWSQQAEAIARACRAFDPWPGLYTQWQGKTLKLTDLSVHHEHQAGKAAPGTVVAMGNNRGLYVGAGEGMLVLNSVQLEGRRAVSGEDFLRGYPEILGARLGN